MPEPKSVRALLTNLIDYAGLFPPAKLDMASTVRNYGTYVKSMDEWMLGRLIVPAARLDEFEEESKGMLPTDGEGEPWLLSALTSPAGHPRLGEDLDRIAAFNEAHAEHDVALIDVIELKAESGDAIEAALDAVPDELFAFFELPVEPDPRGLLAMLAGSDAGAKMRTGGVTPELYPTAKQVARFIRACVSSGTPFKATAGLHHPLRHRNEAVGADEFGFFNVFIGACLASDGKLEDDELVALLTETDAGAFTFDDTGVAWRGHAAAVSTISQVRERSAIAFGSCSFDEPREDLRALHLL